MGLTGYRYRMFEPNMDEYLDEEVETLKQALEMVNRGWERKVFWLYQQGYFISDSFKVSAQASTTSPTTPTSGARFLGSHNPAQVKRTVLASFTDVLLLPVTIVPRTVGAVGAVLQTGGSAAVQGIAMLNPQRWVGSGLTSSNGGAGQGYSRKFGEDGEMIFEVGADEDDDAEKAKEVSSMTRCKPLFSSRQNRVVSFFFHFFIDYSVPFFRITHDIRSAHHIFRRDFASFAFCVSITIDIEECDF